MKRSAIARNNRNYLLENIQPHDEFISSLLSHNCLTEEQSHFIHRQRSEREKNAELLKIMRSVDETKFSTFVRCLRQTNQTYVARIVANGGGHFLQMLIIYMGLLLFYLKFTDSFPLQTEVCSY